MSDAELRAIGLQHLADEHREAASAAARVEDFQQATSAPPLPPSPEVAAAEAQAAEAAQLKGLLDAQLPRLCGVAWGLVDALATRYAGAEYALTQEERLQLAEATVPVVLKHLPKDLSWLVSTPEGVLLGTAAMIYGFKAMGAGAPQSAPVVTPEEAQPGATA